MYVVQSKKKFKNNKDATYFILSVIAEAGLEDEFENIQIREDLCGRIKDLWGSEEIVSKEFKKLSEELTDPIQKQYANKLSDEYKQHKNRLYELSKHLNCWKESS